jgi:hypothetical protein
MSPPRRINLTLGKADRARARAFVPARRPSASLNDNLVDIRFLQQFATDGVKAGATERSRLETFDMDAVEVQDAPNPRNAADHFQRSDRDGDPHDHDGMIDEIDFDAILPASHIYAIRVQFATCPSRYGRAACK